MTAVDARYQLGLVLDERVEAVAAGLDANAAYMRDLESDVAAYEAAYVGLAVTEIAVLRADLGGALQG